MVPEDVRHGAPDLTPPAAGRARRESRRPARPLVLLAYLEDPTRRLAIAVALSLALHEIVASVWPAHHDATPPRETVAQIVTVARRTAQPTPMPTPAPVRTPPPPLAPRPTPPPHPSFAPHVVIRNPAAAAVLPRRHRAGGRAHRRSRVTPIVVWHPVAIAAAPIAVPSGDAAGAANGGAGTGAGAGAGDSGRAGTGNGAAGSGTGDAGDTNAAPCGSVGFFPAHTETASDGSQAVTVEMDVTLRAGTTERDTLGWRWHYPSAEANPFNATRADESISMQLPPPGYDLSRLKPAIAYAIRHTSPEGILAFEPCP